MWVHMGLGEGTACCPVAFGFFELCTPESCPWVHLLVQQTFPEHFVVAGVRLIAVALEQISTLHPCLRGALSGGAMLGVSLCCWNK